MRNNFIFSPRKFCTLCILLKFSLQAGQFFIQNISFFLYLYAARTNHLTFQNSEKVSQAKIKRSLYRLAVFHVPEGFMFANCFILKHIHTTIFQPPKNNLLYFLSSSICENFVCHFSSSAPSILPMALILDFCYGSTSILATNYFCVSQLLPYEKKTIEFRILKHDNFFYILVPIPLGHQYRLGSAALCGLSAVHLDGDLLVHKGLNWGRTSGLCACYHSASLALMLIHQVSKRMKRCRLSFLKTRLRTGTHHLY